MEISIPDPRPKYPENIAASAPIGMRDQIRRAASMSGTTAASFIRDAVAERVRIVLQGAAHG